MSKRASLKSGGELAIVDAGPLYAVTDTADVNHQRSMAALQSSALRLIIPALVIAEVTYLVGQRLGPRMEAAFPQGVRGFDIEAPAPEDWPRIADLVAQYADFPLGGTDASVITLAERLGTDLIVTVDYRHFRAVRPLHCAAFRLLPEQ